MPIRAYIDSELAATLSHPLVAFAEVVRQTVTRQDGYLRVRCRLVNDDYLEVALHVVLQANTVLIDSYRYQWMNTTQATLHRRWDNSPHFPQLPGFPHHCHIGDESAVEPSQPMGLGQLLDTIGGLII